MTTAGSPYLNLPLRDRAAVERERADALAARGMKVCPSCGGEGREEAPTFRPWDAPRYETCGECSGFGEVRLWTSDIEPEALAQSGKERE